MKTKEQIQERIEELKELITLDIYEDTLSNNEFLALYTEKRALEWVLLEE